MQTSLPNGKLMGKIKRPNGRGVEVSGHILFAGFGYCARAVQRQLASHSWQFSATLRDTGQSAVLEGRGVRPVSVAAMDALADDISHILLSAPPSAADGDPLIDILSPFITSHSQSIKWIGYLSTSGVYGDHQGAWVDEETPAGPLGKRGQLRVDAEAVWRRLGDDAGVAVHFFRLPGIYGPGRSALESLQAGKARRVVKEGQVFSRIHVDDIASTLIASMSQPRCGRAYNVCDDLPAPPQDVVQFAAELLGVEPPPLIPFEAADLSPMARSFYSENKRLSNSRIKQELGVELKYPTYREGLIACLRDMQS